MLPLYEIIVDTNLDFTCVYLGWVLHPDAIKFSLKTNTISMLMREITSLRICSGLSIASEDTVTYVCTLSMDIHGPPKSTTYNRAQNC